jgi:hypothetical protein
MPDQNDAQKGKDMENTSEVSGDTVKAGISGLTEEETSAVSGGAQIAADGRLTISDQRIVDFINRKVAESAAVISPVSPVAVRPVVIPTQRPISIRLPPI